MSLVAVGERTQRRVGAVFILALGAAITLVLLSSGRSIGPGLGFEVSFHQSGALKTGARIRIAGEEVGEVRSLGAATGKDGERLVIARCFVGRKWTDAVRRGAEYFVATPSVLGEAYLEIGPPPHPPGQPFPEAGPPVAEGERVPGVDPPVIDRFVQRTYQSLLVIGALLKQDKPELDELLAAGDDLLKTLSGITTDGGQLTRIKDQVVLAVDEAQKMWGALAEADAIPRARAVAHDLGEVAAKLAPELDALGDKASRSMARVEGLRDLWTEERRARVAAGIAALRHAVDVGGVILDEVKLMTERFERGEGTMGAFAQDKELYDDLHEVHRILKSQPWTLIVKPGKGQKTIAH